MKILAFILGVFLIGCGDSYEEKEETKAPVSEVTPVQQAAWDSNVKYIVANNCALSGCHASAAFTKTPGAFLKSSSKAMVSSGNMPKGRSLSAAERQALLAL